MLLIVLLLNSFPCLSVIDFRVEMGDGNHIGRSAVIGIACQDLKYEKERGPTQVGYTVDGRQL